MIALKINGKLLGIAATVILLCFLGLSLYNYNYNYNHRGTDAEIFDINKGEVVKRVEVNSGIYKEAEKYIEGITGMYVKVKAFPDKGFIIKIPLEPAVPVKNKLLNDYGINFVSEVFIIFPQQEKPYLLILDSQKRPLFYNFEGETEVLLKILNFS